MFDCVACPVADVVASPVLTSGGGSPPAPTGLVLEMQTTGAAETITLPITTNVDVTIDWGDGSSPEAFTTDSPSHEYATADTYTIEVTGECDVFAFNNGGDKDKLLTAGGSGGLTINSTNGLSGAFRGCGNATSISFSGFLTSGALTLTNAVNLFGTSQDNLLSIDLGAISALSNLTTAFTNTDNAGDYVGLKDCDVTSLGSAFNMMAGGAGFSSTSDYDELLVAWEAQSVLNSVNANFGSSTYTTGSAADTARTALANDHSWTIIDGGGV
jgi:hypothetical protein